MSYIVYSRRGEPVVRVNSIEEAQRYQATLGGHITNKEGKIMDKYGSVPAEELSQGQIIIDPEGVSRFALCSFVRESKTVPRRVIP